MKQVYKDEAEVVQLIDRYLDEIVKSNQEIVNKDLLCTRLRDTMESNRILGLREDIKTLNREVAWREGRLATLKEILAEMRTLQLPLDSPKEDFMNVCDGCGDHVGQSNSVIQGSQVLCQKCLPPPEAKSE